MDENQAQGDIRVAELIQRSMLEPGSAGSLTTDERQTLDQWLRESETNQTLYQELIKGGFPDEERQLVEYFEGFKMQDEAKMLATIHQVTPMPAIQSKTWKMRSISWWAAASLILFAMTTGSYIFLHRHPGSQDLSHQEGLAVGDILPGGDKAVLTLSNGQRISLDSATTGQLAVQGKVRIVKSKAGMISYINDSGVEGKPSGDEPVAYNIISTPLKGRYQLRLPDGSQVWLNASSSLKYPTRFSGKERLVTLTGEAYFEISHNGASGMSAGSASLPFVVQTGNSRIEVLATHFNVSTYTDEPAQRVTLVQGKVRVNAGGLSKVLVPGEQSVLKSDGELSVEKADTSAAVAWKDGNFLFDDMDIHTAFRQIARWYGVDIQYASGVQDQTVLAFIPRDARLSLVVDVLNKAEIHCKLEGKTLFVLPNH